MRLEYQHQSSLRECTARRRDCGRHFGGMMPVVVDQGKASFPAVSVVMKCNFPITLKTAVHTPKACQSLDNGTVRQPDFVTHGNCSERVLHVVQSRQIERYFEPPRFAVYADKR